MPIDDDKTRERKRADGKLVNLEKRRRYELKQERQVEAQDEEEMVEKRRDEWIRMHAHFATKVGADDVARLRRQCEDRAARRSTKKLKSGQQSSCPSPCLNSEDVAMPDRLGRLKEWIAPYMDLKEGTGTLRIESSNSGAEERTQKLFIAEGTENVRLLIQQSSKYSADDNNANIRVLSVLSKPSVFFDEPVNLLQDVEKVALGSRCNLQSMPCGGDELETESKNGVKKKDSLPDATSSLKPPVSPPFHVLIGSEDALSSIAGFHISRGAMACGVVPHRDEFWLDTCLSQHSQRGVRVLALDCVSDTSNLGSMIRCASAFGIAAVVLSEDSCDAWYRRSVRVSMGHIFSVPVVRVKDLPSTLLRMRSSHGVASFAAVTDADSDLVLENVARGDIPKCWCCVMGNEGRGISHDVIKACTSRIRIDMATGVDSLSVPVATGILLHGLRERECRA